MYDLNITLKTERLILEFGSGIDQKVNLTNV